MQLRNEFIKSAAMMLAVTAGLSGTAASADNHVINLAQNDVGAAASPESTPLTEPDGAITIGQFECLQTAGHDVYGELPNAYETHSEIIAQDSETSMINKFLIEFGSETTHGQIFNNNAEVYMITTDFENKTPGSVNWGATMEAYAYFDDYGMESSGRVRFSEANSNDWQLTAPEGAFSEADLARPKELRDRVKLCLSGGS